MHTCIGVYMCTYAYTHTYVCVHVFRCLHIAICTCIVPLRVRLCALHMLIPGGYLPGPKVLSPALRMPGPH